MLDLKAVVQDTEGFERRLARRGADAAALLAPVKRLAAEEAWLRTGIKARRTRNEGRVRALERMRQQRSERRSATRSPSSRPPSTT